jgi:hypothetical protein
MSELRAKVLSKMKQRMLLAKREVFDLEQLVHDLEHTWTVGDRVLTAEGLEGTVVSIEGNKVRLQHAAPFVETVHSRFHLMPAR